MCWHKWNKWSTPERSTRRGKYDEIPTSQGPFPVYNDYLIQVRTCSKCNKVRVRQIWLENTGVA